MTYFKRNVRTHTLQMAVPNNSRHKQDTDLAYGNETMLEQNKVQFNPLNTKLNPICHLLGLLGAHPVLHISRIRVKMLHFKIMGMGSVWITAQNS